MDMGDGIPKVGQAGQADGTDIADES